VASSASRRKIILLTNSGTIPLKWSLINTFRLAHSPRAAARWRRAPQTTVTVSLSSAATNLATGTYTANVWFTNQTSGGAQSLQFNLLVNSSTGSKRRI